MTLWRVIALTILLVPGVSVACTCMQLPEVSRDVVIDAYCTAEVVLIGSIEESKQVKRSFFEYSIRPERNFKGNSDNPVYALSALGGMCGYPFRVGGRYLIFASRHKETRQISASICGWTRPLGKDTFFVDVIDELLKEGKDPCADEAASEDETEQLEKNASSYRSLELPRR
jgi:hypothetical protein